MQHTKKPECNKCLNEPITNDQKKAFDFTMVFCYQNCSSDWEKNLKFEAECREFAKFLRSLEQFFQTVKGQNNFW